jgi:hypothetical protein
VAWLAAISAVVGALVADRLSEHEAEPGRPKPIDVVWRGVIAIAAAIGALVTVPLVAVPARFAQQVNNSAPQYTAGGYAVVGVIIGLVVAVAALNVRAIAANVIVSAGWLWLLAAAAVVNGLRSGTGVGTAQLATWQFSEARWVRGMVNLPAALLMLTVALIVGAAASWSAGRRGDHRVGVAVSGAIGPLLVAAAYLLAVPGIDGGDQQLSAYVTAPYAVIAGLAGSVLVSAIGSKGARDRARSEREAKDAEEHAAWQQSMGKDEPPPAKKPARSRRKTKDAAATDTTATGAATTTGATAAGTTAGTTGTTGTTGRATRATKATAKAAVEPVDPTSATDVGSTGTTRSTGTAAVTTGATTAATAPASTPAPAPATQSTGQGGFFGKRGRDRVQVRPTDADLDDDAYAPARAYVTDTVEDDDEAPAKATGKSGIPRPPMWPDSSRSSRRRKGR